MFGHFATDCWSNKERKSKEANIAKGDSDDKSMLLVTTESDDSYLADWWYMDTGCSSHFIGNKKRLVDFDFRNKTKIRCTDDKYLNVEVPISEDISESEGSKDESESKDDSEGESEGESDSKGESDSNPDYDGDSDSDGDLDSGTIPDSEDGHTSEGGTSEVPASDTVPAFEEDSE
ncbi:uncharacterized protein LOC127091302 [Lathyrus oleraceus]|uniref:uncharacterized protein LOC127091302 n=1 Tax=Pisum sativum TaxID=3888 RepID=UPI0021CDFFEF|nr:uncharacterized protein LOC127091302 [Pisum sativum]